ncbi:MAG: HAD family hydrolase [Parcubacteria group bacterium]|nr:HAD family hydrolase [Parcubacteria group bacterium]
MPKINAVLFDVDGTLLDSHGEKSCARLFAVAKEKGLPDDEEKRALARKLWNTLPADVIVDACWPGQNFEEIEKAWIAKDADPAYLLPLIAGTEQMLLWLRERGFALGLLTHRGSASAENIMKSHRISEFFSFAHTRNTLLPGGKNNPESAGIVRADLARRGMRTETTVFVGDSAVDLMFARVLGTPFVGVLTGTMSFPDFVGHRHPEKMIIPSVASLPALLTRWKE